MSKPKDGSSSTEQILKILDRDLSASMRAQEALENRARELKAQLEKHPSDKDLKSQLASTYELADECDHNSDVIAEQMFRMMRERL